jgi:hypothetical protein
MLCRAHGSPEPITVDECVDRQDGENLDDCDECASGRIALKLSNWKLKFREKVKSKHQGERDERSKPMNEKTDHAAVETTAGASTDSDASPGTKVCKSCKKELPATTEHFARTGLDRPYLSGSCKKCRLSRAKTQRAARRAVSEARESTSSQESSGTRICTCCGKGLPATNEYFHRKEKDKPDLKPTCKTCDTLRNRAYRALKKKPDMVGVDRMEKSEPKPDDIRIYPTEPGIPWAPVNIHVPVEDLAGIDQAIGVVDKAILEVGIVVNEDQRSALVEIVREEMRSEKRSDSSPAREIAPSQGTSEPDLLLTLNLTDYPEMMDEIKRIAKDEDRTPEAQCRYLLRCVLGFVGAQVPAWPTSELRSQHPSERDIEWSETVTRFRDGAGAA